MRNQASERTKPWSELPCGRKTDSKNFAGRSNSFRCHPQPQIGARVSLEQKTSIKLKPLKSSKSVRDYGLPSESGGEETDESLRTENGGVGWIDALCNQKQVISGGTLEERRELLAMLQERSKDAGSSKRLRSSDSHRPEKDSARSSKISESSGFAQTLDAEASALMKYLQKYDSSAADSSCGR